MDKKVLLLFAKRIFNRSHITKATYNLNQLKQILIAQNAPNDCIRLIVDMIDSAPEMALAAQKDVLTEEDVKIAKRRADERKFREEAASKYCRCC